MECYLPTETARLVYGYLIQESCEESAKMFLETSPNLKECLQVVNRGRRFNTTVFGKGLADVLDILAEATCFARKYSSDPNCSEKKFIEDITKILFFDVPDLPAVELKPSHCQKIHNDQVPDAPSSQPHEPLNDGLSQDDYDDLNAHAYEALLENKALHERLAENINKAVESNNDTNQDMTLEKVLEKKIIETIVSNTEADPIFEDMLKELVEPLASTNTNNEVNTCNPLDSSGAMNLIAPMLNENQLGGNQLGVMPAPVNLTPITLTSAPNEILTLISPPASQTANQLLTAPPLITLSSISPQRIISPKVFFKKDTSVIPSEGSLVIPYDKLPVKQNIKIIEKLPQLLKIIPKAPQVVTSVKAVVINKENKPNCEETNTELSEVALTQQKKQIGVNHESLLEKVKPMLPPGSKNIKLIVLDRLVGPSQKYDSNSAIVSSTKGDKLNDIIDLSVESPNKNLSQAKNGNTTDKNPSLTKEVTKSVTLRPDTPLSISKQQFRGSSVSPKTKVDFPDSLTEVKKCLFLKSPEKVKRAWDADIRCYTSGDKLDTLQHKTSTPRKRIKKSRKSAINKINEADDLFNKIQKDVLDAINDDLVPGEIDKRKSPNVDTIEKTASTDTSIENKNVCSTPNNVLQEECLNKESIDSRNFYNIEDEYACEAQVKDTYTINFGKEPGKKVVVTNILPSAIHMLSGGDSDSKMPKTDFSPENMFSKDKIKFRSIIQTRSQVQKGLVSINKNTTVSKQKIVKLKKPKNKIKKHFIQKNTEDIFETKKSLNDSPKIASPVSNNELAQLEITPQVSTLDEDKILTEVPTAQDNTPTHSEENNNISGVEPLPKSHTENEIGQKPNFAKPKPNSKNKLLDDFVYEFQLKDDNDKLVTKKLHVSCHYNIFELNFSDEIPENVTEQGEQPENINEDMVTGKCSSQSQGANRIGKHKSGDVSNGWKRLQDKYSPLSKRKAESDLRNVSKKKTKRKSQPLVEPEISKDEATKENLTNTESIKEIENVPEHSVTAADNSRATLLKQLDLDSFLSIVHGSDK